MSTKPRKRKDKEANTSYDEPKRHIVLSGKRDILGVEGKTDMSEYYEKFHEIPPFNVKADPSILIINEDYPWLRRNKQMTQAKKKWRLSPATIMMIPCRICNKRGCYANFFRVHLKTMNLGRIFSIGASMFIFLVKLITNLWFTQISKNSSFNYSNLKTNVTNKKFIIFLKLMALTEL